MSAFPPSPDIPEDDWAATPTTVRVLVVGLLDRVARLEERANATSRTSSKPPSSDPPRAPPRPARRPSGRTSGGQPGHDGHGRVPLPADQVDRVVDVKPDACAGCGASLAGDDPDPACHPVAEIPRVGAEVVAYRRHTLRCGACGARTAAAWPECRQGVSGRARRRPWPI